MSLRTGLPINVGLAPTGTNPRTGLNYRFFDRNGGGLRPDRIGTANSGIDPKTDRFKFLDINAFQVQALNTPGNAARNSAHGPDQFVTNFKLGKTFRITEGHAIDFRWEAFNLFNTVNFNNPSTTYGATNFGVITSAQDPRVSFRAATVREPVRNYLCRCVSSVSTSPPAPRDCR